MAVSKVANAVLAEFLSRTAEPIFEGVDTPTPWHINCGLCEDFAEAVRDKLEVGQGEELSVIWLHETLTHDDDGPVAFDHELLARFDMTVPQTHPEDSLFDVFSEVMHAVLVYQSERYGTRFYDAQCLQGVASYFDLPLVQDTIDVLSDPQVVALQEAGVPVSDPAFADATGQYLQGRAEARQSAYRRAAASPERNADAEALTR